MSQYPYNGQPYQQAPAPKQSFWQRKSKKAKFWIIALCLLIPLSLCICISMASTPSKSNTIATQATATQTSPTPKKIPVKALIKPTLIPTAKPTAVPTATPIPTPTQTDTQIENGYKTSTTDTTITNLDKDGSADAGNDVHFTGTISSFAKDSSGNTTAANVTDGNSFVQVSFTPITDVTQLNTNDTLEVWGNDQGVASGTNAFGAQIQEVVVQASYLSDQTTGYSS